MAHAPFALKRTLIGRPRASGRDARDAALEDARASDLRVRPAVVGRLCDRGGARRPDRCFGELGPSRPADLDRDRGGDGNRRPLLRARRSGPTRRAAAPTSSPGRTSATMPSLVAGGGAPRRLHPDRCRVGRRRRTRPHLGRTVAAGPRGDALARRSSPCSPSPTSAASASRGLLFALPTYAFVAAMYPDGRDRSRQVCDRRLPHGARAAPDRGRRRRVGRLRPPAGVRLGRGRAHRRRGDLERRQRLPPAARSQRRARRCSRWA